MTVLKLRWYDTGFVHAQVTSDSNPNRRHAIVVSQYGSLCSCESFHFRGHCKHLYEIMLELNKLGKSAKEVIEKGKQPPETLFVPNTVKGVGDLFGGIPLREFFGIVSRYAGFKTILSHQLLYEQMLRSGMNGITIDTEGSNGMHVLPEWIDRWNKKLGGNIDIHYISIDLRKWEEETKTSLTTGKGKDKKVKDIPYKVVKAARDDAQKMVVVDSRSIVKLALLFGSVVEANYGKGSGRIQLYTQPETDLFPYPWKFPIARLLERYNIRDGGMIIIDSITMPIEQLFTGGQQSQPGRKYGFLTFFGNLREIVEEYNLYCILTHHETIQDSQKIKNQPEPVGGAAVGHNFKYLLELTKPALGSSTGVDRDNLRKSRIMHPIRHPHEAPKYAQRMIRMTDEGVIDI